MECEQSLLFADLENVKTQTLSTHAAWKLASAPMIFTEMLLADMLAAWPFLNLFSFILGIVASNPITSPKLGTTSTSPWAGYTTDLTQQCKSQVTIEDLPKGESMKCSNFPTTENDVLV